MKKITFEIKDYMTRSPHTIGFDIPLMKAKEMFREYGIRHLPVLDGGKLVGIVSDRNLKETMSSPGGEKFLTEDAMTPDVYAVSPETLLTDVLDEMAEEKYGSAIVQEKEGKVVGVFTTVDACRVLSHQLKKGK